MRHNSLRGAVTIVGAGQAGLTLGIGLLQYGYTVTIVSDRSPDQIRNGRVTSSQCMFDMANGIERSFGLSLWDEECPKIAGMSVSAFAPTDPPALFNQWSARFARPARSVDQRLKMSTWMEEFERRGGQLVIDTASVASLEQAIKVPLFGSDEHPDGWSVAIHEHQGASRKRMWSQQIAAVRGETPSPFVAAAIVGEATSLVTNWGTRGLSFINADLTLVLARQPVGREMGVEADNHVSASGIAVGSAVLFDREGPIGTCTVSAIANEQRTINLGA